MTFREEQPGQEFLPGLFLPIIFKTGIRPDDNMTRISGTGIDPVLFIEMAIASIDFICKIHMSVI